MTRTHRNSCRVLTWMLRASLWFASGGGAACPCSMMSTLSSSRLILSLIVLLSCCISSAFSRSSAVTFSSCPSLSSSPWARTFSASPSARSLWLSRPISVTVRLKTFSLEEMSLIWTLVLSTCSLSPWPSCSRPWAMTFTSSHAAYCTRFSLEAPPEGELPFLSKGKPVAESTTRQSVRVASVVFMSPVDLNTLGYGVEVGVCVASLLDSGLMAEAHASTDTAAVLYSFTALNSQLQAACHWPAEERGGGCAHSQVSVPPPPFC